MTRTYTYTRTDVDLCARCEHPAAWHRLDDSAGPWILEGTDPDAAPPGARPAEFRCIGYDCEADYTKPTPCRDACPDYVPEAETIVGAP